MNTKITTLFIACAVSVTTGVFAQKAKSKPHDEVPSHRSCGTEMHHEYLKQTRPGYEKSLMEYEKMIAEYLKNPANTKKSQATPTIPVVVHVVYANATENISDLRIQEQIDVLNKDFQKLNSDTALVPAVFKPVAGGANVAFCLAQRDPDGNPTNGIVRVPTTVATFSTDDGVKFASSGGSDAWDVTRYVNIWVCDLGTQLLGYAEFPTANISDTYGLVLNYRYTGKTGASAPFNRGRTGTHEFGHCFNLRHIWGDANCGNDGVADTPPAQTSNYNCPTHPHKLGTCSGNTTGEMFMNYMDYVDDACMYMFSAGQCARIEAVINNAPWNVLQNSDGCLPVVLQADDASMFSIVSPSGSFCAGDITPVVELKNFGSNALTNCTITYTIDGGTPVVYNWTGNLASLAIESVTLPTSVVAAGTHTITVSTSLPNGNADANNVNDSKNKTFTAVGASAGLPLPFSEGFTGTTFAPAGWSINNPDNADTWVRATQGQGGNNGSAKIDNFTNAFTGEYDELITPAIDLTGTSSPQLQFHVAYRLYTNPTANPNFSDTLEVLVSNDCGATYTSVYKKFGSALTTVTPAFSTTQFVPTATQWRQETVSLASYANAGNVYVKFRNISDYEQNMYIDNINLADVVGLNSIANEKVAVSLYPNPTNGILNINITNNIGGKSCEISIYDIVGKKVYSSVSESGSYSDNKVDISSLSAGVYHVEVKANGISTFQKVVLNK